jgi:hypothetical protein
MTGLNLNAFGLLRAFWIGVAALHLYLVAKRAFLGQLDASLDVAKLLLCIAGAAYGAYATVKIEQVTAGLTASPRRLVAFALLLIVGHIALEPERPVLDGDGSALTQMLIALPVVAGTALIGMALVRRARRSWGEMAGFVAASRFDLVQIHIKNEVRASVRQRPPPRF